jgi:hypothetical protein
MDILGVLKVFLLITQQIAQYVSNKQLLEAGQAQSILKGLQDAEETINRARTARANYDSLPVDADEANRDNK